MYCQSTKSDDQRFDRNVVHGSDSPENGKREIGNVINASILYIRNSLSFIFMKLFMISV